MEANGENGRTQVTTQGNARPAGKLIGSTDGLTPAETSFVQEQLGRGHDVEVIPTGPRRTPDFKIDGKLIELKTLSGVRNQTSNGLSSALSSRIMDARGQSGDIVIDAREQPGMTQAVAQRGIARATTADVLKGHKIQSVTVLTPDGVATYRR